MGARAIVLGLVALAAQVTPPDARGTYVYQADAATFTDCATGVTTPVRGGAGASALERAYLVYRREPGQPLLATFQGRIIAAPSGRETGGGPRWEVDTFLGIWPAETCGAKGAPPPLLGTGWKLTRLGDQPIVPGRATRDPDLQLEAATHRLSGTGGCNTFTGTYSTQRDRITIAGLASTRMACATGMEVENAMTAALAAARRWHIDGQHLTLIGPAAQPLLRFEARRGP